MVIVFKIGPIANISEKCIELRWREGRGEWGACEVEHKKVCECYVQFDLRTMHTIS